MGHDLGSLTDPVTKVIVFRDTNNRFHHIWEAAATASALGKRMIDLARHDQLPWILIEHRDDRVLDLPQGDEIALADKHGDVGDSVALQASRPIPGSDLPCTAPCRRESPYGTRPRRQVNGGRRTHRAATKRPAIERVKGPDIRDASLGCGNIENARRPPVNKKHDMHIQGMRDALAQPAAGALQPSYFSRNASAVRPRKSSSVARRRRWSQSHQANARKRSAVRRSKRSRIGRAGTPPTIV